MYVGKCRLTYVKPSDEIYILPIGDLHFGSKHCDIDLFKKHIKLLDNDNVYWIGMGDILDAVIIGDRRFDPDHCEVGDIVLDYADTIVDMLSQYGERCIGWLTGNHENKLRKKVQFDVAKYMARGIGTQYCGYCSLIYLSISRKSHSTSVVLFATHGRFNGRTRSGKVKSVEDLAHFVDADLYLQAHTHDLFHTRDIVLSVNKFGQLVEKQRVFVSTGSYLRSYNTDYETPSYVEEKLYKPVLLGSPLITIQCENGFIRVDDRPVN